MKAQSMSVNLVGPCNAQCPFCISKVTWKTGIQHNDLLLQNAHKALKYAQYHNIDTVLITGSGEPTMPKTYPDLRYLLIDVRNIGIPKVELQTNGVRLIDEELLKDLANLGLNTVAISIASPDAKESANIMKIDFNYWELIEKLKKYGFLVRISLNMIKDNLKNVDISLAEWAKELKKRGVHQLALRELGLPNIDNIQQDKQLVKNICDWIQEHKLKERDVNFTLLYDEIEQPDRLLRRLPFGINIYDYHGLSTCITTCMTDTVNPDEIRSLILQPDGHVYHSWNFEGSILL